MIVHSYSITELPLHLWLPSIKLNIKNNN